MAVVQFTTTIHKFDKQGEKTGWTYFEIPADLAQKLKPGNKKSFRVKGKLDNFKISGIALLPMGGGAFILALNADMRKGIGKRHGAMLKVQLEEDKAGFIFNKDFMDCLADEPKAKEFFQSLTGSHQKYFSKWIDSAKTAPTKEKRILFALKAFSRGLRFGPAMRALKEEMR